MSDNITLPREVAEHLTKMLEECPLLPNKDWSERDCAALTALRARLATPRPEPEKERAEVAPTARGVGQLEEIDSVTSEVYHAPPEDIDALRRDAERYRWLLHWLVKTGLLSRERCRIDSPASYGDWWILRKPKVIDGSALIGYGETEDAAIDAAVDASTAPASAAVDASTAPEDKT